MIFPCLKLFKLRLFISLRINFKSLILVYKMLLNSVHIYFSSLTSHHCLPCTLFRQPELISILQPSSFLSLSRSPLYDFLSFLYLKTHFTSIIPTCFSGLILNIATSGEPSLDPQILVRPSLCTLYFIYHSTFYMIFHEWEGKRERERKMSCVINVQHNAWNTFGTR